MPWGRWRADGATGRPPRPRRRRRTGPRPARLSPADLLRTGASGLRTRPVRVVLSALGIAIGIAAMVAVVGISSSSRAALDAQLASLGTNLITAAPGDSLFGGSAKLPEQAAGSAGRIDGVERVSQVAEVKDASVYRSDRIPKAESGGITVYGADLDLPGTLRADVRAGEWLNEATSEYPAVVLGSKAAERLGITGIGPDTRVLIGDEYFSVVGVLDPVALAPEIDTAALIGWDAAADRFGMDGHPTGVYVRADPERVADVRDLLAAAVNPEKPFEVKVSRPSDALQAQDAADQAFTGLLLGLGGVALLVGGVGVANTMVISVLERRGEIGLRRALGATRRQIRGQFLVEAMVLSALGGFAGAVLGALVTSGYAVSQGWLIAIPPWALVGGVLATIAIGALAGLLPAMRAARLAPTAALGSG
ncbi:putative ABC transport system permease protein [Nocardiopsis mwathae]|uniref:Putative ABC transport system permease protein n=1 Tax=Nocardiopsis mwathae TaxID=1472723 RepID=A0A7W9YMA7_9ACTN|nr:ABC transporter permease [Nocardiopsis mwathae]MBB6174773.1 putative ABC transport system permease protein [Nocardiopsis mwathae]